MLQLWVLYLLYTLKLLLYLIPVCCYVIIECIFYMYAIAEYIMNQIKHLKNNSAQCVCYWLTHAATLSLEMGLSLDKNKKSLE